MVGRRVLLTTDMTGYAASASEGSPVRRGGAKKAFEKENVANRFKARQ